MGLLVDDQGKLNLGGAIGVAAAVFIIIALGTYALRGLELRVFPLTSLTS